MCLYYALLVDDIFNNSCRNQLNTAIIQGNSIVITLQGKAFDKVPQFRLIKKLKAHGVDGNVAKWIFSCLLKEGST